MSNKGTLGLMLVVFFFALLGYQYDQKLRSQLPATPMVTATPALFSVTAKVGDNISYDPSFGGSTFLNLEVVESDRFYEVGKTYSVKLPASAWRKLSTGDVISLNCRESIVADWMFCDGSYTTIMGD